jgi:hypothetical protein
MPQEVLLYLLMKLAQGTYARRLVFFLLLTKDMTKAELVHLDL